MREWTVAAQEELQKHLDSLRAHLQSSGADPDEVIADIKTHIEEELSASKIDVVTANDIKRIISKLGVSHIVSPTEAPPSPISTFQSTLQKGFQAIPQILVLLLGIVLPLATIGVEITTRMCTKAFFDPIPTIWHILLVTTVPLINLWSYIAIRKKQAVHLNKLGWLNGIAIGVSVFYTILYLPILPLAFIALTFGMGILPLAPVCAFLAAIWCRFQLKKIGQPTLQRTLPGLWKGSIISVVVLLLIEVPVTITRIGMNMAESESSKTSLKGINLLRSVGNDEMMLRLCYQRPGRATDIIGFLFSLGDPVHPEEARKIYYRVKGIPFNSVPPPLLSSGRGRWDPIDLFEFDDGQGGEAVAGVLRGLALASSRIDSSIDPDAAVAYTEWIMEFENKSNVQNEARAQIHLPPRGTVSRLTLWVNGEEREAAFAGRAKTREAYSKVVRARRDPVLVTTDGPDRVLVQCFPVPPNGGKMKIRIGITSPLILEDKYRVAYRPPYIIERNFGIPTEMEHSVWVESKKPMSVATQKLTSDNPKTDLFGLRGRLGDADLASGEAVIRLTRSSDINLAWAFDPTSNPSRVVTQQIVEAPAILVNRVILVIDGSNALKEFSAQISDSLSQLPPTLSVEALLASDDVLNLGNEVTQVSDNLKKARFIGGQDNVPALLKAWDMSANGHPSAILWIHGPQPVILRSLEELKQRWERRPDGPPLYEIQVNRGPNRIIEKLDGIGAVHTIPRMSDLKTDLANRYSQWDASVKRLIFKRARISRSSLMTTQNSKQTSAHLARLWAFDEILRLYSDPKKKDIDSAVQLAAAYQLVTPVSGAVVLETKEQFKQEGLEPANPAKVPTIPEPEMYLLLIAVMLALYFATYSRKRVWEKR